MAFSFVSIPHAIASGFEDIAKGAKWVSAKLASAEAAEADVEAVTSLIPGVGAEAVTIERAGFSALGLVVTTLTDAGTLGADGVTAATELFKNAGADEQLIADFKQLWADYKQDLLPAVASVKAALPATAAASK
jgi:hypothetical protein